MGTWKELSVILKGSTCVRRKPIGPQDTGLYKLQAGPDKPGVVRVAFDSGPLSAGLKIFCWQV